MFLTYGILVLGAISSAFNAHLQYRWHQDYLRDRSEPRDYVSDDATQKETI